VIATNDYCIESLDKNEENMEKIKKYIGLGAIKNFTIRGYYDYRYDEFN
jgi:hypothetical protein